MAISSLNPDAEIAWLPDLTDSDIEKMVSSMIGSLKCDARSFEHAKITYNSDFFKGESVEFKKSMCRALSTFFAPIGTHQFWKKAGA